MQPHDDECAAAKQALQEVFFDVSEKRELVVALVAAAALEDKELQLLQQRQDHLEVESLSRLHALKLAAATSAQHLLDGLACVVREVEQQQAQCEVMLVRLLWHNGQLEQRVAYLEQRAACRAHVEQRSAALTALHRENEQIRALYTRLAGSTQEREREVTRLSGLATRLDANMATKTEAHGQIQGEFQRDLAGKERPIVKLETEMEALTARTRNVPQLQSGGAGAGGPGEGAVVAGGGAAG